MKKIKQESIVGLRGGEGSISHSLFGYLLHFKDTCTTGEIWIPSILL